MAKERERIDRVVLPDGAVTEVADDVETEVSAGAGLPALGETPIGTVHPPDTTHTDGYLRTLLLLLVSATFFEGYDSSILALLLGDIQSTFKVSEATLGLVRGPIELGLFFAFFLTRLADRWGRRPLLLWSVVGYTLMTALTAFSWDIWSFAAFQFGARVFLGAEYAIAITMIVEEFPTQRRARALGTLLACAALGVIVIGIMLNFGVQDGPLEWRTLYLVGLIPLVMLSLFRRRIKETRRFTEERARMDSDDSISEVSFWEPWAPQYRKNLLLVGLLHFARSLPLFGSTAWWAFYAERERGFSSAEVGFYIIFAYGLGVFGYYICGRLMERIGRRPTGILYFVLSGSMTIVLFQVPGKALAFPALILAVFFGLGVAPVMGAFATELFPTRIRGQAAAWVRNIFEIAGFVGGPLLVGVLGDHQTGVVGNIGDACSLLAVLFLPAVYLVWRYMPETQGKELEEIAV